MTSNTNAASAAPFISSSELFSDIPQEVIDHIEEGGYEVTHPNILVCIDGRTPAKYTYGGGTTPGGTLGTLASMFSGIEHEFSENNISEIMNRDRNAFRNIIFEILKYQIGGGKNVYYHTDEHACECGEIGCGHLKLALEDNHDTDEINPYKLSEESKKFIEGIRKKIYRNKSAIVLPGKHEEKYVLHVQWESHSVIPNTIHQAFVSTPDLVERQKKSLARKTFPLLNSETRNKSAPLELADAMIQSYIRHTRNTVAALATGLPHYSVSFTLDGKIAEVKAKK